MGRIVLPGSVVVVLGLLTQLQASPAGVDSPPAAPSAVGTSSPLAFVPNRGQLDARVRFSAHAGGASVWLTGTDARFAFAKETRGVNLRLRFVGADPDAAIEAARPEPGKVNYLLGNDPGKWHTGLPTYGEVVYHDLWPGIDLVFRGEYGKLKYELRLEPGADPGQVRLAYRGAERLALGKAGDLRIETALGVLRDSPPASYQVVGGRRVPVASRFGLHGMTYGFALGAYDPKRPLVIDPGLAYSTYLGGSGLDKGGGVAVDGLVGGGIAVDSLGNAYVTGHTASDPFPATAGAFDTSFNGREDVFVTKLNATGSSLVYSTYLGGSSIDQGLGIAVDAAGNAYVTGVTTSDPFPTTPGAFETSFNGGGRDGFVTKLNATGSALVYSTYLGGAGIDEAFGIALDAAGNAYMSGRTTSDPFPTTPGAFDTAFNGGDDAFVTKLNAAGSAPVYSTYLGGTSLDEALAIAVDAAGNAYVSGVTSSDPFSTTPGAFDTTYNGMDDAFVTKLNAAGSAPAYSTYLGGSDDERALAVAIDPAGNAYVTGPTSSDPFPTTPGAFDTSFNGGDDAFVTKVNATGSLLAYGTYFGGSDDDFGNGVAIDANGSAYVLGSTASDPFPTTAGTFDTSYSGAVDAFVAKLDPVGAPATLTLSPPADTNDVGTTHTVTAAVTDAAAQPVAGVVVRFSVTGSVNASGQCTTGSNGQCGFTYAGPSLPGADLITAYADNDGDGAQDAGEPTATATKAWVLPTSTPGHASGGGNIEVGGNRIAFGFTARSRDYGFQGSCNVIDQAAGVMLHCTDAIALVISGNAATVFGNATINGVPTTYRIDAVDNGEPGRGVDTFSITTATGYSRSGALTGGNVQVR